MTLEEAKKIALIVCDADDGCTVCIHELAGALEEAFPEFIWTVAEDVYRCPANERVTVEAVPICPLCNAELPRYSRFKIQLQTDLIYHLWGKHQYDLIAATKKADEILKGEKQNA